MSGLELLARLGRSAPGLPVIVATSTADATTRRLALEAGAVAVLAKPFPPAELLHRLAQALGHDPRA
jgi:CheY-like chemotaxis protein